MGPEAAKDRALRSAGTALGWLAVVGMLALSSTGVQRVPEPSPADAPPPLAAGR